MSKYCAEDLRNAAEDVENYSGYDEDIIADMLRFAADVLGREKKYEYAERFARSGQVDYRHYDRKRDIEMEREVSSRVVRRSVGEWEEVEDA